MQDQNPEPKKNEISAEVTTRLIEIYGEEAEYEYAQKLIQQINEDLELREQPSLVFNGVSYSQGYEYNQRKAINYSPPRSPKDDRQVSMGIVHEKIISFAAIFLKYVFKRRIKCYNEKGQLIKGLGEIYDLAIEFSQKMEQFKKKIGLIYWELFTQGNVFILEDWEVRTRKIPKAFNGEEGDRKEVNGDNMDYTYEFLDGLTYEEGEEVQYRCAVSRVLDGRTVIFGNPEIEEIQDQPRITLEEVVTAADAEQLFGTLKRWKFVPKEYEQMATIAGERLTLFDSTRFKDPAANYLVHRTLDRENNRFNIFINGIMLFSRKTPMTVFYPRGNYPVTNIPAERLRGSIYARSIPAKTKFNADYIDWVFKMIANKFEQGVDPAILAKGKYTLTRDMFRGGQVTHGVSKDDFDRADPENKGVTPSEFSFVSLIKDIIQSQSVNPTTGGELSAGATATEISITENNQQDKLGYILDGLMHGFMDMALRRSETIESKYTIKQKETVVDGKTIPVYQNFTINVAGIENVVVFDENVGTQGYDAETKQDELFGKAFKDRKAGFPTEYYLANPTFIRAGKHNIDIEIFPEKRKDNQLKLIQMWDDFAKRLQVFGQSNNVDEMKKEYLETSGKPDSIFTSQMYQQLDAEMGQGQGGGGYNMGSLGKPTVKVAQKQTQ
jgi:hypothetical protein